MSFLDLAGPDSDVDTGERDPTTNAPPKKKSFLDLAGPTKVPPPVPQSAPVVGGPLLAQSPSTVNAVTRDIQAGGDGSGRPPTFNGMPLDATSMPPVVSAGGGRGMVNPPLVGQPQPVAPTGPILHGFDAIPREPGAPPIPPAAPAAPSHWWDTPWAAMQAGVNTANAATGGTIPALNLPDQLRTAKGNEMTGDVGDFMQANGPSIVAIGPELGMLGERIAAGVPTAKVAAGSLKSAPASAARVEPAIAPAVSAAPTAEAPAFGPPPVPQTAADQAARQQTLSAIGLQNVRTSALAGDAKAAATDLQTSKLDSPAGNIMRAQLDSEKAALNDYSDGLVKATGGTPGLDSSSLYARGNTQLAPLDALKDHFDAATSTLYKAADAKAAGVPTAFTNFGATLDDASELTNPESVQMRSAVQAFAKKAGMTVGDDGSLSGTALQAETVRKYLGQKWSPQNNSFVSNLKDSLDQDVMGSAGEQIYGQARALWAQRAATLDNPNGIAKIMNSSGPSGINRSVPIEKIPDALAGMPSDQFGHVIDTLTNSPPEIQPQAQAALSEIKAHFANKVQALGSSQQGQWNAKGVSQYLDANSARMNQVFSPDEMAQFKTLNDAGHILAKDQSYPGAAVQAHNLVQAGVAHGLQAAGAGIGGTFGGPIGAAVGGYAGNRAAAAIGNAASVRAVNARFTRLSDVGK